MYDNFPIFKGVLIYNAVFRNSDIVSASEDGFVELWDSRTSKSHCKFAPHTNEKLARPDIGKWMGSATLSEDWIV